METTNNRKNGGHASISLKDKKLISIDVGGTLYGHKSINNGYGNINNSDDFYLGMSSVSMRTIAQLMEKGKYILINSKMEDGEMLKKIVADINYFYGYQLTGDAEFDSRELKELFESRFYIASFGGNKISRLEFDGAGFKCETVTENVFDCQSVFEDVKNTECESLSFGVKRVQFKYGDAREVVDGSRPECLMRNAHFALVELENRGTESYTRFAKAFEQNNRSQLGVSFEDSGELRLEKFCEKSTPILKLCDVLGLSAKDAIHIGDSSTDKLAGIDSVIVNSRNYDTPNHSKTIEAQLLSQR